jgi:hypothetical protein
MIPKQLVVGVALVKAGRKGVTALKIDKMRKHLDHLALGTPEHAGR